MTEHIKQQISVFIDDELASEECEFFVRRLQRDVESRNQYIRYQVIGAAIRGEHITPAHGDLRARVQDALQTRPVAVIDEPVRRSHGLWRWAAGGSIAVGVAAVALLGLRFGGDASPFGAAAPMASVDRELERLEPPSYVVPLRVPERVVVTPTIQLTGLQYLMHHGRHASTLGRTVVHSNVVAGSEADIVSDEAAQ